mgnify:CR=1 FL=1
MTIKHHGAVNGVTGSCHELLYKPNASVLIDCGLFQGAEVSGGGATAKKLAIDFPIDAVQALIVTHVHIDHVGRIPYLLAAGFSGPIYCSRPSAVLLPLVIEDAVKVGVTRNRRMINAVVDRLRSQLVALDYNQWQDVDDGLSIRLQRAGHILGSAYVECKTQTMGKVVFSGDLGAPHTPLLPAPKPPYSCDVLVIESTYGNRNHEGRAQRVAQLQQVLEGCFADGGAVLIPAFSIGRTQELLYELEAVLLKRKQSSAGALRIIVDSPLAARFTDAYQRLQPYWDAEAHVRLRAGRHPLSFDELTTVSSHGDHLAMVKQVGGIPACAGKTEVRTMTRTEVMSGTLVLAASGMCSGGRVVNYLKAMLHDARNDIVFVGYQAHGTPGRDILTYAAKASRGQQGYVSLDGERYSINAKVHELAGYSAHAGQRDLVNFVKRIKRKPKEIRIVHGDAGAKVALAGLLQNLVPQAKVWVP